MKKLFLLYLMLGFAFIAIAQKPKNGTYIYKIAFVESNKILGGTCLVVIKGDSITVIATEKSNLSLTKKGEVLDRGIIMKHKSGEWIIGHQTKDKSLDEVGYCTDGPRVIDFRKKLFWLC